MSDKERAQSIRGHGWAPAPTLFDTHGRGRKCRQACAASCSTWPPQLQNGPCDSVLAGGHCTVSRPSSDPRSSLLALGYGGPYWSLVLSITTFLPRAAVSSSFGRLLPPPSCHQVGRAATKRLLVSRRETAFGARPSWGSRPAP